MVVRYRNQNYSKLKRGCQHHGELFTDPEFPPTNASLFINETRNDGIVWKRPKEICSTGPGPKLIVEGISSSDLNQGSVGNCWFIAACSALALEKKLWEKVVPDVDEQEWDDDHPEHYAGIFYFRFWRLGEWVDVVIDDYLPCTSYGHLIYVQSKSKNEFWSALLEKAYAKMAGSYEALTAGETGEALVDFTGGVNEMITLSWSSYESDDTKQQELFHKMEHAHKHKSLITCCVWEEDESTGSGGTREAKLDCGLVNTHAYCVTDVKKLSINQGLLSFFNKEYLYMVRVRNPWGSKEWNGAWSDESEEWNKVPKKERDKLGLTVANDGEFWMELHDWIRWFFEVSICHQVNTKLLSLEKTWYGSLFQSEWKEMSAGGSINHKETFLNNPQYAFNIPQDKTEVMLSLYQKDVRYQKGMKAGGGCTTDSEQSEIGNKFRIGVHVMKVEENRRYRCHTIHQKAASVSFSSRRSVFDTFTLNTGRYVMVPSTYTPGQERKYALRLYTEKPNDAKCLERDVPTLGWLGHLCCYCVHAPQAVITVHLDSAKDLAKQDIVGVGADPYCIVKCGRSKAITPVKRNTLNPNFKTSVQFYVSNPGSLKLIVEVWNSNMLVDRFMGRRTMMVPRNEGSDSVTGQLMGREETGMWQLKARSVSGLMLHMT